MTRTKKSVKWNDDAISLLISLYGKNIKNFLDPYKVQSVLWENLLQLIKADFSLPETFRRCVTFSNVRGKWSSLQKHFKLAFYNQSKRSSFPYFEQMNELLTDYATEHLNETKGLDVTDQEGVSAFVKEMLDQTGPDGDISLLRCVLPENDRKPTVNSTKSPNETCSEASKVMKALAKLPKDSICVKKAKMRIVPNTPFNRHCQLSTIIKHRGDLLKQYGNSKQKKSSSDKPSSSTFTSFDEMSRINTRNDTLNFNVEALNECDLMEVSYQFKELNSTNLTCSYPNVTILDEPSVSLVVPEESKTFSKRLIWDDESSDSNLNETAAPAWFQEFLVQYNADMKSMQHWKCQFEAKMIAIDMKLDKMLAKKPLSVIHCNVSNAKK